MAIKLSDIKYFFNNKSYPFSMIFLGRKIYADAGKPFLKRDGSYFIHETLLGLANKGVIAYEMKSAVDRMVSAVTTDKSDESEEEQEMLPGEDSIEDLEPSDDDLDASAGQKVSKNIKRVIRRKT